MGELLQFPSRPAPEPKPEFRLLCATCYLDRTQEPEENALACSVCGSETVYGTSGPLTFTFGASRLFGVRIRP